MIRLRFSNALSGRCSVVLIRSLIFGLVAFFSVLPAWAGTVMSESALRIAQGQVRHHMAVFGSWNGAVSAEITDYETISLEEGRWAYHFRVHPTGYVIVAAYDNMSPIPFYSTRSTFDIFHADNPNALEAWMVSRLNAKTAAAEDSGIKKAASLNASMLANRSSRVGNAWTYFNSLGSGQTGDAITRNQSGTAAGAPVEIIRGAKVEPLLTTAWGQDAPYNIEMPDDGCASGHTLTGCVATAWAQVLNYWQWPPQSVGGEGAHTYTWQGNTVTADLSVDLSDTQAYDWANMPGALDSSDTTQDQNEAVSKLMYALAVAAEMDFGCPESSTGSGSSLWADQVLDTYFRFKPMDESTHRFDMKDHTADQWLSIIKNELDAEPPRPVIFSMGSQLGWHEVVIDGYVEGVTDTLHVNFGWEGTHDAYFDITDDDTFNAGGFDWSVDDDQIIVVGIEPDNAPPVIQADDIDTYGGREVTLSVTSEDPEGVGIRRYEWTQVSGPDTPISNSDSPTPTITAPTTDLFSETDEDLVFQVKVYDMNRAFSVDTCEVNVRRPESGSGGGGGSKCFITILNH